MSERVTGESSHGEPAVLQSSRCPFHLSGLRQRTRTDVSLKGMGGTCVARAVISETRAKRFLLQAEVIQKAPFVGTFHFFGRSVSRALMLPFLALLYVYQFLTCLRIPAAFRASTLCRQGAFGRFPSISHSLCYTLLYFFAVCRRLYVNYLPSPTLTHKILRVSYPQKGQMRARVGRRKGDRRVHHLRAPRLRGRNRGDRSDHRHGLVEG